MEPGEITLAKFEVRAGAAMAAEPSIAEAKI
jgi:hypothetical protein